MEKFLKPREGLIVRDPESMVPLPEEGMLKSFIGWQGRYWRRRVNCGDCIVVEQKAPTKKISRRNEEK